MQQKSLSSLIRRRDNLNQICREKQLNTIFIYKITHVNSSVVVRILAPTEPNWVRIPPSAEKKKKGARCTGSVRRCRVWFRGTFHGCGSRSTGTGIICGATNAYLSVEAHNLENSSMCDLKIQRLSIIPKKNSKS